MIIDNYIERSHLLKFSHNIKQYAFLNAILEKYESDIGENHFFEDLPAKRLVNIEIAIFAQRGGIPQVNGMTSSLTRQFLGLVNYKDVKPNDRIIIRDKTHSEVFEVKAVIYPYLSSDYIYLLLESANV
jgi:hypothetical protein